MSNRLRDQRSLQLDDNSEGNKVFKMNYSLPASSSRLTTGLCAVCAICLVLIIILIVALRNPAPPEPDRTFEYHMGNQSKNLNTKVDQLSQEGKKLMEKLKKMDTAVEMILNDNSKVLLSTKMESVLTVLGKLSDRVRKLLLNGTVQESCPEDWFYYSLSCYYVSKVAKSWDESVKLCEDKKSHLVAINSEAEQHYTFAIAKQQYVWIGLMTENKVWKWVDGMPYNSSPKFWTRDEPAAKDEKECVYLSQRGDWYSERCTRVYRYICEMDM